MSLSNPHVTAQDALDYHKNGRPGKLAIVPTKPMATQRDLALAYTPGVAVPVLEIQRDPDLSFDYTSRGNLVAVISNGTAVLGLGNCGATASKPVMEGKAVLFKRFADVDVFDIEINADTAEEVIRIVKALEPTFGGVNLEDIKAPECFIVEETLKSQMSIPVFHDDQHGTAIISGAGLLNALEIIGKKPDTVRLVVNGAGASAVACAEFYVRLGLKREHIVMVDSKGVIFKGRTEGMNEYKERFANSTKARTLAEALVGADVFVGLSKANVVSGEMVKAMAPKPIIFALANPDPEIPYEEARAARPDAIIATGRSDYPNQINNVLGFPFIFRGALDVRATAINDDMKVAAARSLANLAKEDIPDSVLKAYGLTALKFGPEYLIPKPLDPRVLIWEASAVAEAAMKSGVARLHIDIDEYREKLEARLGKGWEVIRHIINKVHRSNNRVVFGEGEHPSIIRAAHLIETEEIARPILLGRPEVIARTAQDLGLEYRPDVIDPNNFPEIDRYSEALFAKRHRKGLTLEAAQDQVRQPTTFGPMMVELGEADAFLAGITMNYPEVIRPALQVVGVQKGLKKVCGLYVTIVGNRVFFLTDPTVNIEPSAADLSEIAIMAADFARTLDVKPEIAMLSFSNFGSTRHPLAEKVANAVQLVRKARPNLKIDGEMQADTAVSRQIIEGRYPFSHVKNPNVLVFPDLQSANIAYKLLHHVGGSETIGPVLLGMGKPIQVLQTGDEVRDIVNLVAVTVLQALERS